MQISKLVRQTACLGLPTVAVAARMARVVWRASMAGQFWPVVGCYCSLAGVAAVVGRVLLTVTTAAVRHSSRSSQSYFPAAD